MKNKGITLISLVITIVILIILASVAIYLNLGNNGIFTRAKEAKEATNRQTATEIINLKITNCQMNKYAEEQRMPTLKELSKALIDDEIEYVTEQSRKQGSTEYNVPSENPSSIYTKLKKYPYEFEINGQLQLASIDGVEIATKKNNKGRLKRVVLGRYLARESQTFDVSVYPGYQNFTEENFACSPIYSINFVQMGTTNYGTISYDSETGIVTFPVSCRKDNYGPTVGYEAYLYYIDYTE